MTWETANADLRKLLNDGPTDKIRYRKRVLGLQDGTNTKFKTLEFRRVISFTTAPAPVGVYVDEAPATVSADDLDSGEFTLATAPSDGAAVRATYYIQFFTDAELNEFLLSAAQWLGLETVDSIISGLQPAALKFAAGEAYQKLALKFADTMADVFQLEDAPQEKKLNPVTQYQGMSKQMFEQATKFRDDFYQRQGRTKQPLFGMVAGRVAKVEPNR